MKMKQAWVLPVVAIAVAAMGAVASGDQSLGAGVKAKEATTIKALYATPEKFVGKAVRVDGVVSAVCEEMGCWMAIAATDNPELVVRFKVEEGKGIVFPISAKGKTASAEGKFEKIDAGDDHAKEAMKEHAAMQPSASDFGKKYQIHATGAVVR